MRVVSCCSGGRFWPEQYLGPDDVLAYGRRDAHLRGCAVALVVAAVSRTVDPSAPEVINRTPYTSKVDMWSLGTIVYLMCVRVRRAAVSSACVSIARRTLRCRLCGFPPFYDADIQVCLLARNAHALTGEGFHL